MSMENFGNSHDLEKNAEEARMKYRSIYLKIQEALILEMGYHIDSPDPTESSYEIHRWYDDESGKDYRVAFYFAVQEHPDLIEIYNKDQAEALRIVKESFEKVHQHA